MNIDFSKSIDYWKGLIAEFLKIINDFWTYITGKPFFKPDEPTGEAPAEEASV